jgi:hypothetical protein
VFSAEAWIVRDFTVDDAYITLRYAKNFASGAGLVFEPTTGRAEGYSSFLWTVLLSVPHRLGLNPVAAAKAFGVGFSLLLMAMTFVLARRLCRGADSRVCDLCAASATLVVGAYHATAVHAVSGMETTLCALLLTLFVTLSIRCHDAPGTPRFMAAALAGLLLGLARPEMNFVVGGVALVLVFGRTAGRRRAAAVFAGGYLAPAALYFAWRFHYYGLPFPLPFYVKGLHGRFGIGLKDVLWFVSEFVSRQAPLLAFMFVGGLSAGLSITLGAATVLILFFAFPEAVMNFDWRYLYPTVPLLAALSARGLENVILMIRERARIRGLAVAATTIWVAVWTVGDLRSACVNLRERRLYARCFERAHVSLGTYLRAYVSASGGERPVLAIGDAGAVPYISGWRSIDSFGLNDVRIARTGSREPGPILDAAPDVVVLLSRARDSFEARLPWEADLFAGCRDRGLCRVAVFEYDSEYFLWCMADPASAVGRHLDRAGDGSHRIAGLARRGPFSKEAGS